MANGRVLILATSTAKVGDRAAGAWSEDICGPYYLFTSRGYDAVVCSVAGGDVPLDPASLTEANKTEHHKLVVEVGDNPLKGTVRVREVDPHAFDILFLAGGLGACVDFLTEEVTEAVTKAYAAGKTVAAVGHGVSALVKVWGNDGDSVVKGKRVTCFSNAEEASAGLAPLVPFSLEEKLRACGARVEVAPPFSDHALSDGRLITGQNHQSAVSAAKLAIKAAENPVRTTLEGSASKIGQVVGALGQDGGFGQLLPPSARP